MDLPDPGIELGSLALQVDLVKQSFNLLFSPHTVIILPVVDCSSIPLWGTYLWFLMTLWEEVDLD